MQVNVGRTDRVARFVVGGVLTGVGALAPVPRVWRLAALAAAGYVLTTAATRHCPLYTACGCDTDTGISPQDRGTVADLARGWW